MAVLEKQTWETEGSDRGRPKNVKGQLMRVDRSRATLTRTQTRNLQQDLNLSQTLNSQGKRSGMHGEWDDIHSFGALETFGGTPPSPESPEGRRLPGPWEGLWEAAHLLGL